MNRRDFIKRATALAVSSAFPLPAVAQKINAMPLDAAFLEMFSAEVANEFWTRGTCRQDVGLAAAHAFDEQYFCAVCGLSAEHVLDQE